MEWQPGGSRIAESHDYRRRISAILLCILFGCTAILVRLFDRTVLQNGLAEARAQEQTQVAVKLNPFRGNILLHGDTKDTYVPLALNEPKVSVEVVPRNIKDARAVAKALAPLIGMSEQEIYDKINNDKAYIPPIKKGISLEIGQQIDSLHLVGVSLSNESSRAYPEGSLAAQVLGFVNGEGDGQYGIEGYYNSQLQGLISQVTGTRDGWGNTFIDRSGNSANKGSNIVLSLDRDIQSTTEQLLQKYVEQFKAKSGSVVIMEPSTGRILAMANAPTYDPSTYNTIKSEDQGVFKNPSITRQFEPGSVMKTMAIAAALDAGRIKTEDHAYYGNSVKVDDYEIHNATDDSGDLDAAQILIKSSNVGMVSISSKLGRELEFDYLDRFNFGRKTGVELDTESPGSMPQLKDWRAVNTATISFGQGITVTPLQMTAAYAAIANKGIYMEPHIIDQIIAPGGQIENIEPKQVRTVLGEDANKAITTMLTRVVNEGNGKRAKVAGYTVAGKTGTAQIAKTDGRGYEEGKNNGSFAGFAPANNPKFAMFVTLEEPQGVSFAESSAAPLWGEIAQYVLKNRYHVTPDQ